MRAPRPTTWQEVPIELVGADAHIGPSTQDVPSLNGGGVRAPRPTKGQGASRNFSKNFLTVVHSRATNSILAPIGERVVTYHCKKAHAPPKACGRKGLGEELHLKGCGRESPYCRYFRLMAKSIYLPWGKFDISPPAARIRYAMRPSCPAGHIECVSTYRGVSLYRASRKGCISRRRHAASRDGGRKSKF